MSNIDELIKNCELSIQSAIEVENEWAEQLLYSFINVLNKLRPYVELGEMMSNGKYREFSKNGIDYATIAMDYETFESVVGNDSFKIEKLIQQIREQENG